MSAALGTATAVGHVGSLFFLLPIGSTAVALDLSRHGTMPRSLAIVHAAVAFAVVPIIFAMWTDSPVGGLDSPAGSLCPALGSVWMLIRSAAAVAGR